MSRLAALLFLAAPACIGDTEVKVYANPEQTAFTQLLLDCEGDGGGEACLEVAAKVAEGSALGEPDAKGACTYYSRACSLGKIPGCAAEARCLEQGVLGEPQYPAALDLYLTACTRGDRDSCKSALSMLSEGRPGMAPDPAGAQELLKAGCEQGDQEACGALDPAGAPAAAGAEAAPAE